jgi:hypothetical protein
VERLGQVCKGIVGWAGLLSFKKPMEQDADSIASGGRQHDNHANREWIVRSCHYCMMDQTRRRK